MDEFTNHHPLFDALSRASDLLEAEFPVTHGDCGIGRLGLILERAMLPGDYWCSPSNAICFAGTGGDGAHFSLIEVNGRVTEKSPVVVTTPDLSGDPRDANVVVGTTLRNFLEFGLRNGYFAMGQFPFNRELTLNAYSPGWISTESSHHSVGYSVGETESKILERLAEELDLQPFTFTKGAFEAMQLEYLPTLQFRPEELW